MSERTRDDCRHFGTTQKFQGFEYTPSADYERALEMSKEQHRESKTFSGKFIRPYRGQIKAIIERLDCRSMIDYGCGKGLQYEWTDPEGRTLEQYWGMEVVKYDPAHPKFEQEPSAPADIVVCSHVLSIIPLPDIEWVVDRIYALANKAVFIVTGINSAPKKARKAAWRLENTPQNHFGVDDWLDILRRRLTKDIEIHLVIVSKDENVPSGVFQIYYTTRNNPARRT